LKCIGDSFSADNDYSIEFPLHHFFHPMHSEPTSYPNEDPPLFLDPFPELKNFEHMCKSDQEASTFFISMPQSLRKETKCSFDGK
jgi:hypothetical protein